jgi:antitoxin component YwqK of YwqJK toxin-antitoxin module
MGQNKTIILIILISIFINKMNAQNRVLRSELKKSGGLLYFAGKPFSGTAFSMWNEKQVRTEVAHVNGKITGTSKKYFENGKIEEIVTLKDGKKNGLKIEYWSNGNKRHIRNYSMDVLNGEYIDYYQNGKIQKKKTHKNGVTNGLSVEFYDTGKKKSECTYSEGRLIDECKIYDEFSGKPIEIGNISNQEVEQVFEGIISNSIMYDGEFSFEVNSAEVISDTLRYKKIIDKVTFYFSTQIEDPFLINCEISEELKNKLSMGDAAGIKVNVKAKSSTGIFDEKKRTIWRPIIVNQIE